MTSGRSHDPGRFRCREPRHTRPGSRPPGRIGLTNPAGLIAIALLLSSCAPPLNYTNADGPRYTGCAGDASVTWNPRTGGPPDGHAAVADAAPADLSVVSFNIKFSVEIDRAIALLRGDATLRDADILLLQEMDEPGVRRIGEALGLCWVYYPAVRHPQSGRDFGNAILSRYPFIEDHKVMLPRQGRFGRTRRMATAVTLDVNGVAVRVYSVHLATWIELGPAARREQAMAVVEDAARFGGPLIVGGDLNEKGIGEVFVDAGFDWLTRDIGRTTDIASLDHLFTRRLKAAGPLPVTGRPLDSGGASDHVPVWMRLRAPQPEGTTMHHDRDTTLPDFDALWDFNDPAATESRFRAILPAALAANDTEYRAELMTQIARTLGLQQKFVEAHALLDEADDLITREMKRARTRSLLERGRVINSSGTPEESISLFDRALSEAQDAGLDGYAVDAAHMLGIVTRGEDSIAWNRKAMEMAEGSSDPKARRWRGSLCNNLGWTYFDLGNYGEALKLFEKHLAVRTEEKNAGQVTIARWSIAKTYRMLKRVDEALAIQRELLEEMEKPGAEPDGYVYEEMGECLTALGRADEARPHFAQAWELLHTDPWLARDEAARLDRLKRLGQ